MLKESLRRIRTVAGLLLLGITGSLSAQDFQITTAAVGPDNKVHVQFPADTNFYYYILLRGDDVTNITAPANLTLATAAGGDIVDPLPVSSGAAAFYRVLQVLLTQPLDTDNDGIDDVYELRHAADLNPVDSTDANKVAPTGRTWLDQYLNETAPITIAESSPANGESGVAVTRETVFRFKKALSPSTLLTTNNLYATFGGRRILSRIELSSDHKTVTLFYGEPLPASARVRVTFNGDGLTDYLGRPLDLDGDGKPGGNAVVDFDTLSITPVAGTAVIGHIIASLQVPVVSTNSTTNFVDHPLAGVLVSVIGAEQEIFTTTDGQGFFRLTNCPAGRFFVSIDGRTSPESNWPNGAYYPMVGKPWEAVAGRTNNLAGGTGLIYLPLVQAGTLQYVDTTTNTTIGFPPEVIAANPTWAGVSVTIPTNALYSDNGTRGGRVGLAPVPADRLPERLPAGIVHALDISIQTDGPQNVDRPLPVRFPNLPDPQTGLKLPPGAKSALMSYNHDTGRWEVQGPMTVTADGNYVETDPGVGVRQPGWHGAMPGAQGGGGPLTGCTASGGCNTTCNSGSLTGGSVDASATEVCIGASFSFSASGVTDSGGDKTVTCPCDPPVFSTIPPGPFTLEWKILRDGSEVASGSGASTPPYAATNAGNYTCSFTAKSQRECPPSDHTLPSSPSVKVAGIQKVTATGNGAAGVVSLCQNAPIDFSAQVQQLNCGNLIYAWSFSDGGSSTAASPSHQFPGDGDYYATVTVSCSQTGCTDSKSSKADVNIGKPLNSVDGKGDGQDSVNVYVGQPVQFTAITDPPNMVDATYTWNFNDGTSDSHAASVSHAFLQTGDKTVQITVSCGNGPAVTDNVTVHVTAPPLPPIEADIVDDGSFASGVDQASIKLTINNVQVTPLTMPISGGFHIYHVPSASEVPNPHNSIHLEASDKALGDGAVGNGVSADWDYPN